MDTKELNEAIDAMVVLAEFGAKVMADGKVGADDLSHLVSLSLQMPVLTEGFKDIALAKEEIKDLDQGEVVNLLAKVYSGVSKVEEARRAAKA